MYYIDYDSFNKKFTVSFENIDFNEAVLFLRSIGIYYSDKIRKNYFEEKKSLDILALLRFNEIEHELSYRANDKFVDIVKQYKSEQEYFRRNVFDDTILNESIKLFDYQKKGLEFTLSRKRSFIADSPGLGKTISAICTFSNAYKNKLVDKVFIVVRPGLSYNWFTEILNTVNLFKEEDILIINNSNKKLAFDNIGDKKIIIVSNHLLKAVFLSYKKDADINKSAKHIKWKEYVNIHDKLKTDKLFLVIDEAHELTNSKAISTNALLHHIHFFDYRICLSATPTGNRFEKYFNAMQLIDKGAIALTEIAFKCYISKQMGNKFDPYAIINYNVDNIKKIKESVIDLYFIKRLKEDLPEMKYKAIVKPIYFEMSDNYKKLYQAFIQNEIDKIEIENKTITLKLILQKFPYLSLIIDNPFLLKDRVTNDVIDKMISKWKFEYDERFNLLKNLLDDYIGEQHKKILVFDNHPLTLSMLAKEFEKYNPLLLHGKMGYNESDKKRIQDEFNDTSNDKMLLLANPQVGGVGLNFNKGTNRCIFYTMPNDAVLMEQAKDRIHRINNTQDAIIEILLCDKSIDILRYNRNMSRMELNEKFLTRKLTRDELKNLLQMTILKRYE